MVEAKPRRAPIYHEDNRPTKRQAVKDEEKPEQTEMVEAVTQPYRSP